MQLRSLSRPLFVAALFCVGLWPTSQLHADNHERIPARAFEYQRILHAEVRRQWGITVDPQPIISVGAGTIHQESGWDPRARSAYANGLTQFTPSTWGDMMRLDDGLSLIGDVWNPSAAIRAMVSYHRRLFSSMSPPINDRWPFVLSGYNGGWGNTTKDMLLTKTLGGNPGVWWGNVELHSGRLPMFFKENRDYVRNILKRWVPLYSTF